MKRGLSISAMLLALVVPLARAVPSAGEASTEAEPQVPAQLMSPDMIAAGRQLYAQHCTQCHGADGTGGVRLAGNDLDAASTFRTISQGRARGGLRMPTWKGLLTDEQIWQLTAYVMSLK